MVAEEQAEGKAVGENRLTAGSNGVHKEFHGTK